MYDNNNDKQRANYVPKAIRQQLNIQPGNRIHFFVGDDGNVTFVPVRLDVRQLKGILPKPNKPVSVEEMNAAIIEAGSCQ